MGESALGRNYSKFLSNSLWVTVAAVDFIHVGHKLDALTDDEEDNDHDKDPRHTGLLDSQCLLTLSVLLTAVYSPVSQPQHSWGGLWRISE